MLNIFNTKKSLGNDGETFVANYLKQQGYTILERNYARRMGEIDIIASNATTILFVEVKTRMDEPFDLATVITKSKQQKIIRVAKEYLLRHTSEDKMCQFDVALLIRKGNTYDLTYLSNAFTA